MFSIVGLIFAQDVLSVIGSPNSVYYKTDDKIKIHTPTPTASSSQRTQDKSDFYYNYVNFGMVRNVAKIVGYLTESFFSRTFYSMVKVIQ